ncbi:hypothetical protein AEP_01630 [Curvibacter sp. AEP1-3]|nr:hypothetical protein AEP_01630 [Curvibacter sp. AEP1-3]
MQDLGHFLGFGSQRPDKSYKDGGPDNLWALSSIRFAVIECKSGLDDPAKPISKDFCNQLLGSESWFKTRYEGNLVTDLILIHPSSKFGPAASPAGNMRVMDIVSLQKLKVAVDGFVKAILFGDTTFAPAPKFAEALVHFGLDASHIVARYTVAPT